jgi:hypothetical protein
MNPRSVFQSLLILGIVLVLFPSCTLMQLIDPPQGELRLMRLQMPEITGEDLPYDVVATFEADGRPTIKRACFRWLTERASLSSPPLHCYASEVQGNQAIDSVCSRWVTEGRNSKISPLFCLNLENVEYGYPGRFVVKIQTRNVATYYNWLECYAEYSTGGGVQQSNKIRTEVRLSQ